MILSILAASPAGCRAVRGRHQLLAAARPARHLGLVVALWLNRLGKGAWRALSKCGAWWSAENASATARCGACRAARRDRYIKSFSAWDHLVALVFGQLGGLSSRRKVETVREAQSTHHYHLGSGVIRRSTLSDANRRRPSAIFAEVFGELSQLAGEALPRHGKQALRLLDATAIPLTSLHKWAQHNGRTRGLKTHVVYDPAADRPVHLERRIGVHPIRAAPRPPAKSLGGHIRIGGG